jgi:fatty acid desaturase
MNAGPEKIDPYQPYRSRLLRPDRLRELSQLRTIRAVRDISLCWLWIVSAWVLVAIHPAWYTGVLAIAVIASRFYALTIIGHDGLHRRLTESRARNDLLNDLFIMAPIGAITRLNNLNHLNHHAELANPGDPDRFKHACFNKAEAGEFLLYLTGIGILAPRLGAVLFRNGPAARKPAPDRAYRPTDFVMIFGWQLALLIGLTAGLGWWAYPLLWLLPVYLGAYVGDNIRSFAEHSHPESDQKADQHRLLTYDSNWLERIFLAPMNMNFHATHHLYPSIPYYNLPIADREIRSMPEAAGLEWRSSYLGYLWRYWRALPLTECRSTSAAGT